VLEAENGERLGFQATWFRSALTAEKVKRASNLGIRDLYFFHGALTRPGERSHVHDHAVSRRGAGWAGAATDRLCVHLLENRAEQGAMPVLMCDFQQVFAQAWRELQVGQ